MKIVRRILPAAIILCLMVGATVCLHAAERVYLRNGSNLLCDHRENVNGLIRLYLTPSAENYVDVSATDIVGSEAVQPDTASSARSSASTKKSSQAPADVSVLLDRAGAKHHLDPDLLASVVHAESGGDAHVVSPAGARGLMQLMPATARDLGIENSFLPEQNIAGGVTYLDALLMYYHDDLALALAAYNAGPMAVNRYGGIPPYAETRRYVARVIHDYNRRKLRERRRGGGHVSTGTATAPQPDPMPVIAAGP